MRDAKITGENPNLDFSYTANGNPLSSYSARRRVSLGALSETEIENRTNAEEEDVRSRRIR